LLKEAPVQGASLLMDLLSEFLEHSIIQYCLADYQLKVILVSIHKRKLAITGSQKISLFHYLFFVPVA
jgi:hypothetical protein